MTAAHIQFITSLPVASNSNSNKIHEFYEKLIVSVQALDTIHKLRDMKGYVRLTLDKLLGSRADLVRLIGDWQEWDFPKLVESLRSGLIIILRQDIILRNMRHANEKMYFK